MASTSSHTKGIEPQRKKRRWPRKIILVLIILAAVVIVAEKPIESHIIARISSETGTRIEADSVDLHLNGSFSAKGLRVFNRDSRSSEPVLKARTFKASIDLLSLFSARPRVSEIVVSDFDLNLRFNRQTGRWSLPEFELFGTSKGRATIPAVRLKNGALHITSVDPLDSPSPTTISFDAMVNPVTGPENCRFQIETAGSGPMGKVKLHGCSEPGKLTLTGGLQNARSAGIGRKWGIDVLACVYEYEKNGEYSMKLNLKGLNFEKYEPDEADQHRSPLLENAKALGIIEYIFDRYSPCGIVDVETRTTGNFNNSQQEKTHGTVYLRNIAAMYRKMPYRLNRMRGQIDFTDDVLILNNLRADHNDVNLSIDGWVENLGPQFTCLVRISSPNMLLDRGLYQVLNEDVQRTWRMFSPEGLAAVDYYWRKTVGCRSSKAVEMNLLDVDAKCSYFPYPLKQLKGKIYIDSNTVTVTDLVSEYRNRKITVNGRVSRCDTGIDTGIDTGVYDIRINAAGIPLDDTLAQALSGGERKLYHRLELNGTIDADVNLYTEPQAERNPFFSSDIHFYNTSMNPQALPGEITDANGQATITPGVINIQKLTGRYGNGDISISGKVRPSDKTEKLEYDLDIAGQNFKTEEITAMLAENGILNSGSITGKINYSANIVNKARYESPRYRIEVDLLGNRAKFDSLPYHLNNIHGGLTIDPPHVLLKDITALIIPDTISLSTNPTTRSNLAVSGRLNLDSNSGESASLQLECSNIPFGRSIEQMLGAELAGIYRQFAPAGEFDLHLDTLTISNSADNKTFKFDGKAQLRDFVASTNPLLSDVEAVLDFDGLYSQNRKLEEFSIKALAEKLQIKDKPFTNLTANLKFDPNQWQWQADNITADCCGGVVSGQCRISRHDGKQYEYLIRTGFEGIDLSRFFAGSDPNRNLVVRDTTGIMSGSLSTKQIIGDPNSRIGTLKLSVSEMKIGRLSPFAKLVEVLRLHLPENFAFDRMVVDSFFKGDKLLIQEFDLSGRSLAFEGVGWVDFPTSQIHLTLTARGSRLAAAEPSVFQSFTENLGRAVVRVHVEGKLSSPEITTTTLPLLGDTVNIFRKSPTTPK